jgi:N6-adenosine-specific RNA methylase IME4
VSAAIAIPTIARVVLADPPWLFGDKLPGKGRGAQKHYPGMPAWQIARFPLPELADDSLLFLWRVGTHQEEALMVMGAWGFKYCGEIVWNKRTTTGKKHFGMGRVVRAAHEVCLIGKRGRPTIKSKSVRSVFDAPVGEHSAKPDAFYEIVEKLSDGPYVELFARRPRAKWTSYGNQLRSKG